MSPNWDISDSFRVDPLSKWVVRLPDRAAVWGVQWKVPGDEETEDKSDVRITETAGPGSE
jgi:hypothetical protein